jgi:hypothetical protein
VSIGGLYKPTDLLLGTTKRHGKKIGDLFVAHVPGLISAYPNFQGRPLGKQDSTHAGLASLGW